MAKKFVSWSLIVAAALLAGCAIQPSGQRFMVQQMPKDCPDSQGRCDIKVGIDRCSSVPNVCDLYVEYDIVRFGRNRGGPIQWDLQEPGYVFPSDGITFDAPCAQQI